MNPTGTGATFREQSTWAQLITSGLILGAELTAIALDPANPFLIAVLLAAAVALQVIALIVLHIAFALWTPPEPDDERDALIALRSVRYSQRILGVGVVLAIMAILAQQAVRFARSNGEPAALGGASDTLLLNPLLAGHLLLVCFVGSEIVRLATQAIAYRRGA